jgi:hypothetical protein
LNEENSKILRQLLPTLETLYKNLREKHVDLAMMLSTCVEFIVMNVSSATNDKEEEEKEEEEKTTTTTTTTTTTKQENTTIKTQLQRAISDTESAMVPVRAHGLAVMCRTVSNRSNKVESMYENIIKCVLIQISDDESYVYLNAVNLLVALCDRFTKRTLNRLFEELNFSKIQKEIRWLQQKLRVVEVLDRVAERLGEMLPPHASRLVSVLMSTCTLFVTNHDKNDEKEEDITRIAATIRASSLSALGTVCNTLHISSIPNLAQIFRLCSSAILETLEKHVSVRRAAANLLHNLVIGRNYSDFFSVSNELKGIYTTLRRVESGDSDTTTRRLVSSAANEIDDIMKSFILPSQSNSKKREFHIRVL